MLSDLLLMRHDDSPVRGTFRLTAYREGMVDGSLQGILTLEDASGRIDRVFADCDPAPIREMGCPALVRGVLWPDVVDGKVMAIVESLETIEADEVENGAALLPRSVCDSQALPALRTLIAFNGSIADPVLRSFLSQVLVDDVISYPLMDQLPNAHCAHPFKGGLLAHCTEWLDEAGSLARLTFREAEYGAHAERMVTITQMAYLFHDLYGAILSDRMLFRSERLRGILIQMLLGPQLKWLALKDPDAARDLRVLLTPLDGRVEDPGWRLHARAIIQRCDDLRQARNATREWAHQISADAELLSSQSAQLANGRYCHV